MIFVTKLSQLSNCKAILKIHALLLLAIISSSLLFIFYISCGSKSINPWPEVISNDRYNMIGLGNCLPIQLQGIEISQILGVCDKPIRSVCYLPNRNIIASDDNGDIYFIDNSKQRVITIARLPSSIWKLSPLNNTAFLASRHEDYLEIICLNVDGRVLWRNIYPESLYPLIVHDEILICPENDSVSAMLVVLSLNGEEIQCLELSMRPWPMLIPTEEGVLAFHRRIGPRKLDQFNDHYIEQLWLDHWDSGTINPIYDAAGRVISFSDSFTNVHILNGENDSYNTINSWISNDDEERYPGSGSLASNGNIIAVMYSNKVLKYHDGQIDPWILDISNFNIEWNWTGFYIDKQCNSVLISFPGGLLFCYGDNTIIHTPIELSTELNFINDWSIAVAGTNNGEIVQFDLISSSSCE